MALPAWPFPSSDPLELPENYATARASGDAVEVPLRTGGSALLVTRHDLVGRILGDSRLSARPASPGYPAASQRSAALRQAQRSMVRLDGAEHQQLRRAVLPAFAPKTLKESSPRIELRIRDIVTATVREGKQDVAVGLATQVPIEVMALVMGLPLAQARELADQSISVAALTAMEGEAQASSPDPFAPVEAAFLRLVQGSSATSMTRKIIDELEEQGVHSEQLQATTLAHVFTSGLATVRNTISLSLLALSRFPDQFRLLHKASPELLRTAADELLRYTCTPRFSVLRATTAELTIGNQAVQPGTGVIASIAAANRDPRVFDLPDDLNLTRRRNPHLTFAPGTHGCAGAALATLQLRAVLSALGQTSGGLVVTDVSHHAGTTLTVDRLEVAFETR